MEHKDIGEDDVAGSDAPPSSTGRIPMIKIKIPKKVAEDEEIIRAKDGAAAAAAAAEEVKSHCCKECNKSFSSGKALGGHMSSAHVQANKDYSFKKLSSKRKTLDSGPNSGSVSYACNLCHKSFSSEKSLFGHMRCHPEREWRGMEPPPEMKINSSASDLSEDDGDGDGENPSLGFNLKSWASSSKRGRGPVINPAIQASEEKENESFVSGLQLIRMLNDGECSARRRRIDDDDRKGLIKKLPENQESGNDPDEELFNTAIQVLVSVKRGKMDTTERPAEEKPPAEITATPQKQRKGLQDSSTTSFSPDKHRCNVCGRVFPTHQALGGHRSSHNKLRLTVINTDSRSPPKKYTLKKSSGKVADNVAADAGSAGSKSSSAFAFAFDLNMEPEDEEGENGVGASSHHTP